MAERVACPVCNRPDLALTATGTFRLHKNPTKAPPSDGWCESAWLTVEQARKVAARGEPVYGVQMTRDHTHVCDALGLAAADIGELASSPPVSRDEPVYAEVKEAVRALLRAHQLAHESCPTAETLWPSGQKKPSKENRDG